MKEKFKKSFLLNLAVVLTLCALLYILFFASLRCVTRHGDEVMMPNVTGRNMDSVLKMLTEMNFEVQIDSTYEPTFRPLSVLKQVPDTGSFVKRGRTIFLTVNMLTPPRIPMPNVKDLSYRSAEMILRNNKLVVGDTTYKPDIATGAILEALYEGKSISPGALLPQGSKIDLIIGNGLGNTEWDVPNVTDMTVNEARITLSQFNLQPILVSADPLSPIVDTEEARIIDQRPRAFKESGEHNRIKMGDFIDLQIMQNPSPQDIHPAGGNNNPPDDVNDYKSKKNR